MITINNLNNICPSNEFDIRVDRKSAFGNPFRMLQESDRDGVCEKYEEYFQDQVINNVDFKQPLDELICLYKKYGILNLFCWCYPKRCHSETIRAYILKKAINEG